MGADESLLVWCGNGHHSKVAIAGGQWTPMGYHFARLSRLEPFCIDQTLTVGWPGHGSSLPVNAELGDALRSRGGTAGFLCEDVAAFADHPVDALIASIDNAMI